MRDLEDDHFVKRNDVPERETSSKGDEEDSSTSKSENDTVGSGDITAIRVCPDQKQNACLISSIRDKSVACRRYVHAEICHVRAARDSKALIRFSV